MEESPERLRIGIEAPREGYLVVGDAYAPGWRATIGGEAVPIEKANGIFRAVRVPAGRHVVEMIYRPGSVTAGLAVSLMAALAITAWSVRARRLAS